MKSVFRLVSLLSLVVAIAATGMADVAHARRGDQDEARQQMQAGTILSIRQIERIVLPRMPGMQYLGPEYDARSMVYRLKFISDGRVIFVDVDARSGGIIGQTR